MSASPWVGIPRDIVRGCGLRGWDDSNSDQ